METTRIDTNIWGPLVQDEQLVVQVHVQWSSCISFPSLSAKGLFTFYDTVWGDYEHPFAELIR